MPARRRSRTKSLPRRRKSNGGRRRKSRSRTRVVRYRSVPKLDIESLKNKYGDAELRQGLEEMYSPLPPNPSDKLTRLKAWWYSVAEPVTTPREWPDVFDAHVYATLRNSVCGVHDQMSNKPAFLSTVIPLWVIQLFIRVEHLMIMRLFPMHCRVFGKRYGVEKDDKTDMITKCAANAARLYLQQRTNLKGKVWSVLLHCALFGWNGLEDIANVDIDVDPEVLGFVAAMLPDVTYVLESIFVIPYNADIITTVQNAVSDHPEILYMNDDDLRDKSHFWTMHVNVFSKLDCRDYLKFWKDRDSKSAAGEPSGGSGSAEGEGGGDGE